MKLVAVVGARPQFVKAGPLVRALRCRHTVLLVHTGQHYDANMSDVFFDDLDLPRADVHLGVGSGGHGAQTGAMLARLEPVLVDQRPDWVIVFGDTNSTVAGALGASKLHQRVAHVEAGLRSFNRRMPEEINRVVTDHLSDLLLCPSATAARNLEAEGIERGVHIVGDVMIDALVAARGRATQSPILERIGVRPGEFVLATIHRAENTDNPEALASIVSALAGLSETVVFPVHPRTRGALQRAGASLDGHICALDPVGYLDMLELEASARVIVTDSGGVQKEAFWLGVPCVTVRTETEWVETVDAGWNVLVGTGPTAIASAVVSARRPETRPTLYGDGTASARILELLEQVT